jgi:hypothetical protein
LSEPLHLNILSCLVAAAGSFEAKVYFDLVLRNHNAYCLLQAARFAKRCGYGAFTAIEFGVADGAGLMNMAEIARRVTKATGIKIELIGCDSGAGLPPPVDYRDHPDFYRRGGHAMQDFGQLRAKLPASTRLVIGNIAQTVTPLLSDIRPDCPLGYVVMDVDYYSSTVDCLKVFSGPPELYLPEMLLFLDDIASPLHNPWQGELLAIDEFNSASEMRKVCPYNFLRQSRLLKNAPWIDQVYLMHVLDHKHKRTIREGAPIVSGNPYLRLARKA